MNRWLSVGSFFAFAALGVAACGGSDSDKYPSPDSFCQAKAQAECQVAARCGVSADACTSARKSDCMTKVAKASANRTYRPANADACVSRTQDVYSSNDPVDPSKLHDVDVAADDKDSICAKVFTGDVKTLAPCTGDLECEGDLICDKKFCAEKNEKPGGQPCGNPGDVCASGFYCDVGSTPAQCKAVGAAGAVCDETHPCDASLRCSNNCKDRVQSGGACTTDDDCASSAPYCDPNLGNKCDAGQTFAAGAAACKSFGGS